VFEKKTKKEGDRSKVTVTFFFFVLQQNKQKDYRPLHCLPKKKRDDNVAAIAFFAIEGDGSKLTTIAFCDA